MLTLCDKAIIALLPIFYIPIYFSVFGRNILQNIQIEFILVIYLFTSPILHEALIKLFFITEQMATFAILVPPFILALFLSATAIKLNLVFSLFGFFYLSVVSAFYFSIDCNDAKEKYGFSIMLLFISLIILIFQKQIMALLKPKTNQPPDS